MRAVVLALIGVACFAPAVAADFVADDFQMLKTVEAVDGPLWPFARNDLGEDGQAGHFYRPVWVLANAAVSGIFGDSPAAYHLFNLILLAIAVVAVGALTRRLLDGSRWAVAAGLFAVYPRHGESVAWASGNTDLLATALILGSLLCLFAKRGDSLRLLSAAAFAVAAAATKEIGFLCPALALLVLLAVDRPDLRRLRWRAPAVLLAALVPVFVIRLVVIGSTGGYSEDPVTIPRLVGSAASYALGAITPHELEVLRHPPALLVPLAIAAAGAFALVRVRRDDPGRFRVAALGLAWFAVAILPVLGEPLDLNNAIGERLLFLPSVGLAIAAAALVPTVRPRVLAGVAAILGALCVFSAVSWIRAGEVADRVLDDAVRLAPPGGRLMLLSVPESYRQAHVFNNSFDIAVARRGVVSTEVKSCIPTHIRSEEAGAVSFHRRAGGGFEGATTWSAPFDFPAFGDTRTERPQCTFERAPGADRSIGLALGGIARPEPSGRFTRYVVFDGERLVPLSPARGSR